MFSCLENLDIFKSSLENSVTQVVFDIKNLFNIYDEVIDQIEEIRSLTNDPEQTPSRYQGKCYHSIKMRGGMVFNLIFSHVEFDKIKDHLEPGSMVKIIYLDHRVINIYPQPYYQNMPFEEFLDLCNIDNESLVRVCYFNGKIKKVDFLGVIPEMSNLSDDDNNDDLLSMEESEVKLDNEGTSLTNRRYRKRRARRINDQIKMDED